MTVCYNTDMKNSELLKTIINTMEKEHLKLYHSVSKEEIENYISTLTNIDEQDETAFDCEMLKLFSKFKDAHTNYYTQFKFLDKKLFFVVCVQFLLIPTGVHLRFE